MKSQFIRGIAILRAFCQYPDFIHIHTDLLQRAEFTRLEQNIAALFKRDKS